MTSSKNIFSKLLKLTYRLWSNNCGFVTISLFSHFCNTNRLVCTSKVSEILKVRLGVGSDQPLWPWEFFGYVPENPGRGRGRADIEFFEFFAVISDVWKYHYLKIRKFIVFIVKSFIIGITLTKNTNCNVNYSKAKINCLYQEKKGVWCKYIYLGEFSFQKGWIDKVQG